MEYSAINVMLDFILLLVIVLCAWIGKKRGFIKTFFGFFGSLISFILSSLLARPVGEFLSRSFFLPPIKQYILKSTSDAIGESAENLGVSGFLNAGEEFLARFGVDSRTVTEHAAGLGERGTEELANSIAEYIAAPIASAAAQAVAFIVLFVLFAVLIRILVNFLDLFSRLPGLNFSNRFLGMGVGILWGILIAIILSTALTMFSPSLQGSENEFFASFDPENTILVRLFSKANFLSYFFH